MELPRHFRRFEADISLNPRRARRIDFAVKRAQRLVEQDRPLQGLLVGRTMVQGSFALETVVRPLGSRGRYDVDIILPMDFDALPKRRPRPAYVIEYVHRRLSPQFATTVRRRSKCIRVDYPGDFHIDFVPAHSLDGETGPFEICDSHEDDFIETDPQALIDWVADVDVQSGTRFRTAIKMLKRWRDAKFRGDTAPKSLQLTVLAAKSWLAAQDEPESPYDAISDEDPAIEAFVLDLADAMQWYLGEGRPVKMPGEYPVDLLDSWDLQDQENFQERLSTFLKRGTAAWNTNRTSVAIDRWHEAFGPTFRKFAPKLVYG